jgi:hypothetical protein
MSRLLSWESGTASAPAAAVTLELLCAEVFSTMNASPGQGDAYMVRASVVKAFRDCGSM